MKKGMSLILALALLLSLCACSESAPKSSGKVNPDTHVTQEDEDRTNPEESEKPTERTESTPIPEPTPTPQLIIPDPVTYSGSGDDVVTLDSFDGVFVFHITGNQSERHFSVKGYDVNGESTKLLVNTTSVYEGVTIDPSQETVLLEVKATGNWTIEVLSIFSMEAISSGETLSGSGDSVALVSSYGSSATISGNAGSHHFSVKSYGTERDKLLVNTTDVYEGTVVLTGKPIILEIDAEGEWSISFD